MSKLLLSSILVFVHAASSPAVASDDADRDEVGRGDRMIAEYFRCETGKIARDCLADVRTLDDWKKKRSEYRRQLFYMLGLDPLPERTPLQATVTGKLEQDGFTVEKLHFQSRPRLYVTGNLYVPKQRDGKLPAILYVCGHGRVKKDGVSYGNKAAYHHHGAWFARNGYVCLTIDTLQLGEIEGIHHGTYRYGRWWWNARGYTPAGVEAWNCIRALDYLEMRPEVDAGRIGVTGRSGGGAYSWWIAALDDRIQAAVPVAGITSLANHVVDGCVEGHCDCMYMLNAYRWDFPLVAALVAPRPLLISNSDKDRIFPLDGVVDVYFKARRIYELYRSEDGDVMRKLGLHVTEGPHKDTQELRVAAFHWFNRHLKGEDPLIETAAVKLFEPEQLKVFDELPADEINTKIDETFVPQAPLPQVPKSTEEWARLRDGWMHALREKCFRGWPDDPPAPNVRTLLSMGGEGTWLTVCEFTSQHHIPLRLYVVEPKETDRSRLDEIVLHVLDEDGWKAFHSRLHAAFPIKLPGSPPELEPPQDAATFFRQLVDDGKTKRAAAWLAPRGIGRTEWSRDERKRVQIRRRFMLLGQTLDGMRVWDVRRAVQALRAVNQRPGGHRPKGGPQRPGRSKDAGAFAQVPLVIQGEGAAAGIALYASLFEPDINRLDLHGLPASHRDGPIFLNVLGHLDLPQAVAMAAERSQVRIDGVKTESFKYSLSVARNLEWDEKRLQIR